MLQENETISVFIYSSRLNKMKFFLFTVNSLIISSFLAGIDINNDYLFHVAIINKIIIIVRVSSNVSRNNFEILLLIIMTRELILSSELNFIDNYYLRIQNYTKFYLAHSKFKYSLNFNK